MKIKKFILICISIVVTITMLLSVSCTKKDGPIIIIACSDFQHPDGHERGSDNVENIINAIKKDGITSADAFFCCGDYDYNYEHKSDGVDTLRSAVDDIVSGDFLFVQGNHDDIIGADGMVESGDNDPENGDYGVFVINEDDYMWYNKDENRIKETAKNLTKYLNEKIAISYSKPIFVLSHIPLHYNMRTKIKGDGMYADCIFEPLNKAGEKGLNIIFMFGHNHSNGWDDYLGGSSVYLSKGDSMLVAQSSRDEFLEQTLNFTYFNPGYIGYYNNVNGSDDTLTMSVIEIYDDNVKVTRYSKDGKHNLKSSGVRNDYKKETEYIPNITVYPSPQTIYITKVR